jgi:hypothetical protein
MLVAAMVATVFAAPAFSRKKASTPAKNGEQTVVHLQKVGDTLYFDAAGFPGWSVGLEAEGSGKWW